MTTNRTLETERNFASYSMTETNEKLKKNLKETQSVSLWDEDTSLLIDFQEQYGIRVKLTYFVLSALKSRKKTILLLT